jgi:hypothetical protein
MVGLLSSAAAMLGALLLIFRTQAGAHIGAILGLGVYPLGQMELSMGELLGLRQVRLASFVQADCIVLVAIAVWSIAIGMRDVSDLLYRTILNAALSLLCASSIWVFLQA